MVDKRGAAASRARDARLAQYRELRDGGMLPVDAGNELGVGDVTRGRYERWYVAQGGTPQREAFKQFGHIPYPYQKGARKYGGR